MLKPATDALRVLDTGSAEVPDRDGALGRIGQIADAAALGLPDDPRPWNLAGLARLRARQPQRAVDLFRRALATGERAETDLHFAGAFGALGDREKATAAIVRALWISPALVNTLPLSREERDALSREVARREDDLRAGRLKEPPALTE